MKKHFRIEQLGILYETVQSSGIFPDSKYFPDCLPQLPPQQILKRFRKASQQPDFDLKNFIAENFTPPPHPAADFHTSKTDIVEHLHLLWDALTRPAATPNKPTSTLIPLPHPYVVPGGRFREIYYWDSYFTLLGLLDSRRHDLAQNMVDNFAHLIETVGHIPNGNRTYYLSRSQPPFFALMVELLAKEEQKKSGTYHTYSKYGKYLIKEYQFWMAGEHKISVQQPTHRRVVRVADGCTLNRYWDDSPTPRPEAYLEDMHTAQAATPLRAAEEIYRNIRAAAESGWDFSTRWFADGHSMTTIETIDLLPIDLNCLLFFLEKTLAKVYFHAHNVRGVSRMVHRAEQRRRAILQYCWHNERQFFFDFNFKKGENTLRPTLAAVFPLFFQVADAQQAAAVAQQLEQNFLCAGGLRTTLAHSGQQWDAPNGWAPLQYLAVVGLKNYGFDALAEEIRRRWLGVGRQVWQQTGKMMEKYNVEQPNQPGGGGEYPNQDGFGWTNGVFLRLNK